LNEKSTAASRASMKGGGESLVGLVTIASR